MKRNRIAKVFGILLVAVAFIFCLNTSASAKNRKSHNYMPHYITHMSRKESNKMQFMRFHFGKHGLHYSNKTLKTAAWYNVGMEIGSATWSKKKLKKRVNRFYKQLKYMRKHHIGLKKNEIL